MTLPFIVRVPDCGDVTAPEIASLVGQVVRFLGRPHDWTTTVGFVTVVDASRDRHNRTDLRLHLRADTEPQRQACLDACERVDGPRGTPRVGLGYTRGPEGWTLFEVSPAIAPLAVAETPTPPVVTALAPVTWDADDYVSPVAPGDRVVLVREDTTIVGTVAETEGYAPGVVMLDCGVTVDLLNAWRVGVVAP